MAETFLKYHGLGNDFVLLDRRRTGRDISADEAVALCDRHRGVGADGVLVLLPGQHDSAQMVVHNADGSIPQMCGNGIRCAAKFLLEENGSKSPKQVVIETGAGSLECVPTWENGRVTEVEVNMGPAKLVASNLPSGASGKPWVGMPVEVCGLELRGTAVSMGNPHLVLFDAPLERAADVGPKLEFAEGFNERTNVEFVRLEPNLLRVVVWERGVGLTQACGTGACAVAAAAVHAGLRAANEWIVVELPGGKLHLRVHSALTRVDMRGPVEFVFRGER